MTRDGKTCLFIAPHPDDETLGCGGTILKLKAKGASVHWLIVTTIEGVSGFPQGRVPVRTQEIEFVGEAYGFDGDQLLIYSILSQR